jgi:hypothetical protein
VCPSLGDFLREVDVQLMFQMVDLPLQTLFDFCEWVRHGRQSPGVAAKKMFAESG